MPYQRHFALILQSIMIFWRQHCGAINIRFVLKIASFAIMLKIRNMRSLKLKIVNSTRVLASEQNATVVGGVVFYMSMMSIVDFLSLCVIVGMEMKDAEAHMMQLRLHKRYLEDVWT